MAFSPPCPRCRLTPRSTGPSGSFRLRLTRTPWLTPFSPPCRHRPSSAVASSLLWVRLTPATPWVGLRVSPVYPPYPVTTPGKQQVSHGHLTCLPCIPTLITPAVPASLLFADAAQSVSAPRPLRSADIGLPRLNGGSPRGVCHLWFAFASGCRFASGPSARRLAAAHCPGWFPTSLSCRLRDRTGETAPAGLEPADS